MEILTIGPGFSAFIRPEQGANVGLMRNSEGTILIDTASSPAEIRGLLSTVDLLPEQVSLVINTHFHTDHTWGNQLFSCPILAHRLCRERMQFNLQGEWSTQAFQRELNDLVKSDPQKAAEFRQVVENLHIKLPDQLFETVYAGKSGANTYQVMHMGGHTPDSVVVWVPEQGILYASDLIFQGRYPYIFDADIPAWINVLSRLLEFQAEVIIPGHGIRCKKEDILRLREYLQRTWLMTVEHLHAGHSLQETCADPEYPVFAAGKQEKLHTANIRYMFMKLSE
jgi:glyoxylase-like metal-dependent hydrolase (beta-lactamase superfamily II)